MYFQQKLTTPSTPTSSQSSSSANPTASTQKMMTTIMPLMIGFISFTLPSGLSLYWFTSTLFGIGQQLLINKKETVPKKNAETIEEKPEKVEKAEEKPEKDIKTETIEEDIPWIPGYENPASQQNKKNNKKGKPKKKKA